jgi:hypothetical protein
MKFRWRINSRNIDVQNRKIINCSVQEILQSVWDIVPRCCSKQYYPIYRVYVPYSNYYTKIFSECDIYVRYLGFIFLIFILFYFPQMMNQSISSHLRQIHQQRNTILLVTPSIAKSCFCCLFWWWGLSALQPWRLIVLFTPNGVTSFISRGAAHQAAWETSASEGRN